MNYIVNRVNNMKGLLVLLVVFIWIGCYMIWVGFLWGFGIVLFVLWGSWVWVCVCFCFYIVFICVWVRSLGYLISLLVIYFKDIYILILVGLRLCLDYVKKIFVNYFC